MKKLIASMAITIMITSTLATTVSAEEYDVQEGDNLWDIAREYDTTVDQLMEINNLTSNVIYPNQTLITNNKYMVEKDDTLYDIGNLFDVSVKDIKKWNNLHSNLLVIGQELELKDIDAVKKETEHKEKAVKEDHSQDKPKRESKSEPKQEKKSANDKTIQVKATAYTAGCAGCSGVTSTGLDLSKNPNAKVIAVDPSVIPLGTKVYIDGYGYATAADTGGAIKGNRIDVLVKSKSQANNWGVRTVNVKILN